MHDPSVGIGRGRSGCWGHTYCCSSCTVYPGIPGQASRRITRLHLSGSCWWLCICGSVEGFDVWMCDGSMPPGMSCISFCSDASWGYSDIGRYPGNFPTPSLPQPGPSPSSSSHRCCIYPWVCCTGRQGADPVDWKGSSGRTGRDMQGIRGIRYVAVKDGDQRYHGTEGCLDHTLRFFFARGGGNFAFL